MIHRGCRVSLEFMARISNPTHLASRRKNFTALQRFRRDPLSRWKVRKPFNCSKLRRKKRKRWTESTPMSLRNNKSSPIRSQFTSKIINPTSPQLQTAIIESKTPQKRLSRTMLNITKKCESNIRNLTWNY